MEQNERVICNRCGRPMQRPAPHKCVSGFTKKRDFRPAPCQDGCANASGSPACSGCPSPKEVEAGLSADDLVKFQALRDDVRRKLGVLYDGDRTKAAANFFRLDCILDESDQLQKEVTRLQGVVAQLQSHAEQQVKEAVADVLRQVRFPLIDTPEAARVETVYINRGRNIEIRAVNEAADAQAHRYMVDLGPWPEYSTEF